MFSTWSNARFKELKLHIENAKAKLETLQNQPPTRDMIDQYRTQCAVVNQLLQQEEAFWGTRAKDQKLKFGDRNTRYFHEKVKQRRRKNRMKGIWNENGNWVEEAGDIQQVAKAYFDRLFTAAEEINLDPVIDAVHACISTSDNDALCRDFT